MPPLPGLQPIDGLALESLATFLANVESINIPVKKDADTNGAMRIYIAQLITVPFDASVAYVVGRKILFEGQIFQVIIATTAGQTPHTNRTSFKYLGGGINAANSGVNDANALTATYNKTSGNIVFSSLTPIVAGAHAVVIITNSTIGAATDIEAYVTDTASGFAVIEDKVITSNTITLYIQNTHASSSLRGFTIWFNNRA